MGLIEKVLPPELKQLILSYISFPYTRYFVLQSRKCIPPSVVTTDEENNTVSTPSHPISTSQQISLLISVLYGYFKTEVCTVEGETKPARRIFLIYQQIEWNFHYCFKYIKEKILFTNIFPRQMVGLHCNRGSWKDVTKFIAKHSKEPIFPQLKSLSLFRFNYGDCKTVIRDVVTWFPQLESFNVRPNPGFPFIISPNTLSILLSSLPHLQRLHLALLPEFGLTKERWDEYITVLHQFAPPTLKYFYTSVSPPAVEDAPILFANSVFWQQFPFLRYFRTTNGPFQIYEMKQEEYTNTGLRSLDLSSAVQPSIVNWICKHFVALKSLHLQSTALRKEHLKIICSSLLQLTDLNISMNHALVDCNAFEYLQTLKQLEILDISGLHCTVKDYKEIVTQCQSLQNLLMSYCDATDECLETIFQYAICPIQQLVISHNLISFESVKQLTKDSHLKKLEWNKPIISNSEESNRLLSFLKVEEMSIIANHLKTDGIAALLSNKNLQRVNLSVSFGVNHWSIALKPLKYQDCVIKEIYLDQNETIDDSVFPILLQINKRLQFIQMSHCKKIRGTTIPLIPILEFNPSLQYINLSECKLIKQAEEYLLQRESIMTVIV